MRLILGVGDMMRVLLCVVMVLWSGDGWAAVAFRTPAAISAATGTTITLTLPTGHTTNDIILLHCYVRSTSGTLTIQGDSYNRIGGVATANALHAWYWKRHDGSEGNPVCLSSLSADLYGRAYAFSGVENKGSPFGASTGVPNSDTSNTVALTGITTTRANSMVVAMSGYADNNLASCATTATDPATFTEDYSEDMTGADGSICISYATRTTAGATGTVTVDYGGAFTAGDQDGSLLLELLEDSASEPSGVYVDSATIFADSTACGASASGAFTVSASVTNPILLVWVGAYDTVNHTDEDIDAGDVTYNGVALTQLVELDAGNFTSWWYLNNPATGSNTLTVDWNGDIDASCNVHVYVVGNTADSQADATSSENDTTGAWTADIALTTSTNNSLVFTGTNTVSEREWAIREQGISLFGANGFWATAYAWVPTSPAGTVTMTWETATSGGAGGEMTSVSIAPYVAPPGSGRPDYLLMRGVGE